MKWTRKGIGFSSSQWLHWSLFNLFYLFIFIHFFKCSKFYSDLVFPGGSEVKVSASNVGDLGSIPESGRSPGEGNGNPLQYSCLENPMDGGAWWATVHGVAELDTTEWLHYHYKDQGRAALPCLIPRDSKGLAWEQTSQSILSPHPHPSPFIRLLQFRMPPSCLKSLPGQTWDTDTWAPPCSWPPQSNCPS